MTDYERHYERAEVVEDLPQRHGADGFGIGDCPNCDLPFGHAGQHEDIYARPDILATPEEQGLTPGGERADRDVAQFEPNIDIRDLVVAWFHDAEEICEHDEPPPRCEVMADHLLAAFDMSIRDWRAYVQTPEMVGWAASRAKEMRVRSVLAKWLDTAPVDASIVAIEEELAAAGNDWLGRL